MIHGLDRLLRGPSNNARRLDRRRDVVNEVNQKSYPNEGKDQADRDRQRGDERLFTASPDGPEHHQAVCEYADKHPEHQLVEAVTHKNADDPRRVLTGRQGKSDEGDGEHHPGHRDHRAGDSGEQAARSGRTGTEKQRPPLDHMQVDVRIKGYQHGSE